MVSGGGIASVKTGRVMKSVYKFMMVLRGKQEESRQPA